MFAVFGLGLGEIIVLAILAATIGGGVLAVILAASRSSKRGPTALDEIMDLRRENADLRAENRRLRDDMERGKGGTDRKDPPDPGIQAGPTS